MVISKKVIGSPALAASHSSRQRGEAFLGDRLAVDQDALVEVPPGGARCSGRPAGRPPAAWPPASPACCPCRWCRRCARPAAAAARDGPSAASRRTTRPSERSMLLGWSACSRARIRSLAWLAMPRIRMGLGMQRCGRGHLVGLKLGDHPCVGGAIRPLQQIEDPGQRGAQLRSGARPGRPCRARADTPRAGILRAASRGSSARSPAPRRSRSCAPGSARWMSPIMAKEAVTPPVVGSVRIDDVGQPRLLDLLHRDRGARHLHQRQRALPACARRPTR